MKLLEQMFPGGFPPSGGEPVRTSVPGLQEFFGWADLEQVLATSCFEGPASAAIQMAAGLPEPGPSRVCVLTEGKSIWRAPRRCDPEDLRRRLAGATLRVEAVEEVHAKVGELAAALSAAAPAVYINAYAAWGRSPGLALHYDYTEIVVLQLEGRKRWRVFHPTREAVRGPESTAYKERIQAAARGEADGDHEELRRVQEGLWWEGELTPGDALYMPPGWFHEVHPLGEPTLQLSCAFAAPGEPSNCGWTIPLPEALQASAE